MVMSVAPKGLQEIDLGTMAKVQICGMQIYINCQQMEVESSCVGPSPYLLSHSSTRTPGILVNCMCFLCMFSHSDFCGAISYVCYFVC